MSNDRPKIRVCYDPQECDTYCTDPECPYTHAQSWSLWRDGQYVTGPFSSEADAKEKAAAIEEDEAK